MTALTACPTCGGPIVRHLEHVTLAIPAASVTGFRACPTKACDWWDCANTRTCRSYGDSKGRVAKRPGL